MSASAPTVRSSLSSLPKPSGWLGSDNQSGVHPAVLDAMVRANEGSAAAYGADPITAQGIDAFRDHFGADTTVLFTWNGTGANVTALAALLPRWGGVLSAGGAHIDVDEGGAPEVFLGTKITTVATGDGKLRPEHIDQSMVGAYDQHHVWPRVVSITQSTELGTLYTIDEVAAICDTAHRHGILVHMDGARIANATAALGCSLRAHTFDAGVDALSFGGTKNGMAYGEAVLLRSTEHARTGVMIRKQATQLASKMRFISAQFVAMFEDDVWLHSATHANAMATRLDHALRDCPGVVFDRPTQVNSIFPHIPGDAIEPLQEWCPHYTWDAATNQVRWVTSFNTTVDDIDRFAAGVRAVCRASTA
jgi:threonine aldolase